MRTRHRSAIIDGARTRGPAEEARHSNANHPPGAPALPLAGAEDRLVRTRATGLARHQAGDPGPRDGRRVRARHDRLPAVRLEHPPPHLLARFVLPDADAVRARWL